MTNTGSDSETARLSTPRPKGLRPRDAATLMLLDRRGDEVFVLIGRRHSRHAFMPGKFVFPGGRTDPADSRVAVAEGLHADVEAKLGLETRTSPARNRAIALSAVRETYEEAGLLIGHRGPFACSVPGWSAFAEHDVQPSLGSLRLIARAITPPGNVRRYDTRFLACWNGDVAVALPDGGPTDELEELCWLPIPEAMRADIPEITQLVLDDLQTRLRHDPQLAPDGAVPFYRRSRNRDRRTTLL